MSEKENYWTCKIGPAPKRVPSGGDAPLRSVVEEAFHEMFGVEAEACFSGWGSSLDEAEQELLEKDREERDIE